MQPTAFSCSLPEYRPSRAAMDIYNKINEITRFTHMGANALGAGFIVQLLAGRSSGTMFDMFNTLYNIKNADLATLTTNFIQLNEVQKRQIFQIISLAQPQGGLNSDDEKILQCIFNAVRQ